MIVTLGAELGSTIVIDRVVPCPSCGHRFHIGREPPPLPAGLSHDCPLCTAFVILYRDLDGRVKACTATRTGAPPRGQA